MQGFRKRAREDGYEEQYEGEGFHRESVLNRQQIESEDMYIQSSQFQRQMKEVEQRLHQKRHFQVSLPVVHIEGERTVTVGEQVPVDIIPHYSAVGLGGRGHFDIHI